MLNCVLTFSFHHFSLSLAHIYFYACIILDDFFLTDSLMKWLLSLPKPRQIYFLLGVNHYYRKEPLTNRSEDGPQDLRGEKDRSKVVTGLLRGNEALLELINSSQTRQTDFFFYFRITLYFFWLSSPLGDDERSWLDHLTEKNISLLEFLVSLHTEGI